jgi:hypothetical protein
VLAGCDPIHFPIVAAAVHAISMPGFYLNTVLTTAHPHFPFIIVNGPLGKEAGLSNGHDQTPQGWKANIAIARALRIVWMSAAAIKGLVASHSQGYLGYYADCIRENEEESPWEPYHVEMGYPKEASVVTVIAAPSLFNGSSNKTDTAGDSGEVMKAEAADKDGASGLKQYSLPGDEAAQSSAPEEGNQVEAPLPTSDPSSETSADNSVSSDNLDDEDTQDSMGFAAVDPSREGSLPSFDPASTGSVTETDGVPVEINGYACSAIIVLDPDVPPPDVFDQYTYYSWLEDESQYIVISGDLYDELLECLQNLGLNYNLDKYSEIKSDGWILLITAPKP